MDFELRKLRFVRIGLAVLQLYRMFQIVFAYFIYAGYSLSNEEWFYALLLFSLLILFILNKKPVLVAALLAWVVPSFDTVFCSGNYSTAIFRILCIFYAIWAWRVKVNGAKNEDLRSTALSIELDKLYWLVFLVFGVQNLFSGLLHLKNPYWGTGDAMAVILTHPYFGNFSEGFKNWLQHSPSSFLATAEISNWVMVISQIVLIPLYLFRITRPAVTVWMVGLLLWMFVFLGVGFFSWYTLALFVLVFVRKGKRSYLWSLIDFRSGSPGFRRMYITGLIMCLLFFLLKMPYISPVTDKFFWAIREWDTKLFVAKKLGWFGLFEPDVFNTNHLEGGQKWLRIYRLEATGRKEVPIFGPNGEKMNYFRFEPLGLQNHGSDFIMYGNTLSYVLGIDTFTYQNSTLPYKMKGRVFERLLRFDKNFHNPEQDQKYEVEFWRRRFPHQNGKTSWDFTAEMTEKRKLTVTADSVIWNN